MLPSLEGLQLNGGRESVESLAYIGVRSDILRVFRFRWVLTLTLTLLVPTESDRVPNNW
jgi:hypothetical protein